MKRMPSGVVPPLLRYFWRDLEQLLAALNA
jgi:hypothetical protein